MKLRLCAVLLILVAASAFGQEFRGAIHGTIKDASGALLPGVSVTVTNVGTNVPQTVVTDSKGLYQLPHLSPGTYTVDAKLEGFKPMVRKGLQVRIGDDLPIDFKMELGGVSETISVTAATPVLDTTPNTGQVIESKQIEQLPLGDGTAYMLTRLAPGLSDSSDLHFSRPGDNGNLAGITANGALGGNEFTLDGAPNRVSPNNTNPGNNSGVVGFSPPADSISEFKVQTNSFDAQSGHTAGATVNLALKSGTNSILGSVSAFNRNASRSATPLLTQRAGGEKPDRQYDRFTGMLSGPFFRDRTFFMISFEHLRDVQAEPASYTVPTDKMRAGDFSEFSTLIYDPLTASGSSNTRKPFANNQIPDARINPVARAILGLYPRANRPGTSDNYFTNQPRPYDYNAFLARFDHNLNDANRLFLTSYYNKRREDRYNWAGDPINDVNVTQGFDYRSNTGATLGYTSLMTSTTVLDVRGAWSRFGEYRRPAGSIDPATLGFSPAAAALLKDYPYLPFITFGGFSTTNSNSTIASIGSQRADWGTGFNRPFTNVSFLPTVDYLWGNHAFRSGYELRRQRWDITPAPYAAGRYFFNGAYTRLSNSAPLNDPAQEFAQFLLGLPTAQTGTVASPGSNASQFEIASEGDWRQTSHALFVQDDWHLNSRLTVNLGLRMEYAQALAEAQDRAVAGFNTTIDNPIAAAALANYAKSPIAEIPAGAFAVKGGLEFANGPIYNSLSKLMPRAAFSYLLGDKTVIRGGIGLFSYDYYFDAGNQTGFAQPTPIITTTDNGKTFLTDMSNPIPSGQLIQPRGSSLGPATGLGLALGTIVPNHREAPYYNRWQLGVQRDLGAGWRVETFYVNSHGTHLPVQREINGIPFQYLSTSRTRDTANETFLSTPVTNPFTGLLPGSTINGSTVARSQLLRPFPEFQSIITEDYRGSDHYQAGSIVIEKRFKGNNSLVATYTRSHETDRLNYLNPANGELENRISPNDRPNRATVGAVVDLPFGRDHRWGSNWSRFTDVVLGGWRVSASYQYQSGFPLTWSNNIYYDPNRDPRDLRSNIGGKCPNGGKAGLDCTAWDTSGFYIPGGPGRTDPNIQLGNNVRTFPSTLSHVRTANLNLLDVGIAKDFDIIRGVNLQVRVDAINALNYTVLWNPNQDPRNSQFGLVNQDRNNPRDIQLGARLKF
ncbi:MAG TPA: TonB-dependent receptor [Thermoanaerobaculia bacterium]|nr:TonB-dependent receptor [Thermoanaerobaculia bacterium]